MHDFISHLDRIEKQLGEIKRQLAIPKCDLMNYKEAAEYMGISESHLSGLRAKSKIDSFQPSPRIVRFSQSQCDEFLTSKCLKEGDRTVEHY